MIKFKNAGDSRFSYQIDELNVKYTSSNTKVLKINSEGRMYGISKGTAKVKISGDVNYSFTVKVDSDNKIKYVLNGGTLDKYSAKEYMYYVTLRKPTREGYFFKGWYLDKDYKEKVTELAFCGDTTVYAKRSKVKVNDMKTVKVSSTKGSNKLTVKYSKVDKVDGYQIYIADNKSFKNANKVLIAKGTYTSETLKNGKKYYVKMSKRISN